MARVDRYGEPIGEAPPEGGSITVGDPKAIDHHCRRGWIDRDADNPVPCLVCKPHLARTNNSEEETP